MSRNSPTRKTTTPRKRSERRSLYENTVVTPTAMRATGAKKASLPKTYTKPVSIPRPMTPALSVAPDRRSERRRRRTARGRRSLSPARGGAGALATCRPAAAPAPCDDLPPEPARAPCRADDPATGRSASDARETGARRTGARRRRGVRTPHRGLSAVVLTCHEPTPRR